MPQQVKRAEELLAQICSNQSPKEAKVELDIIVRDKFIKHLLDLMADFTNLVAVPSPWRPPAISSLESMLLSDKFLKHQRLVIAAVLQGLQDETVINSARKEILKSLKN